MGLHGRHGEEGLLAKGKESGAKKIVMVEISPTMPNLGRFIVTPTYGMLAVASVLAERSKYNVTLLYDRYVGKIIPEDVVAMDPFIVMANGLTTAAPDLEAFFSRFHELTDGKIPVVAGGEHATMYPEEALKYADYLLMFEGDETVFPLLEALEEPDSSKRDSLLSRVPGLYYRDLSDTWRCNPDVPRVEKINYRYNFEIMPGAKGAGKRFRAARIPLQTSRGCKYSCSFCSWISLYGKPGYRVRPPEDVVHDAVHASEHMGINDFFLCDNLFAGDEEHASEVMNQMAVAFEGKRKPSITCLMRADQLSGGPSSLSEKKVALLARGGVSIVSFGLESLSERSLIQMRKQMTLDKYIAASEMLRRHGISMLGTFASGFDGDTIDDIRSIADFAEKMNLFTVQVYARCITPGTTDMIMSEHRIIPGHPNQYKNGHGVWIMPALMLPSQLQETMFEVALKFHNRTRSRRPAHLIFSRIWTQLQPNLRALKRIESEVLLPMRIYKSIKQEFRIDDDRLLQIHDNKDLLHRYRKTCTRIFTEEVDAAFATQQDQNGYPIAAGIPGAGA